MNQYTPSAGPPPKPITSYASSKPHHPHHNLNASSQPQLTFYSRRCKNGGCTSPSKPLLPTKDPTKIKQSSIA